MQHFCKIPGHQTNLVTSVCTFDLCQCDFRFACNDCIKEQIHLHQNPSSSYLIDLQKFHFKFRDYDNLLYIEVLKSQLLKTEKLIKEIQLISSSIQKILAYLEISQQYENNDQNIDFLNNQQINIVLRIDMKDHIESIQIQIQNLTQQQNQFEIIPQTYIQYKSSYPTISNNEKYLGFINYGIGNRSAFNIRSLSQDKCLYRSFWNKDCQYPSFHFSKNQQYFVIIGFEGTYYFSTKGLKLIFKSKFRIFNYDQIKWINNYQFITQFRQGFIIYDIFKKRVIKEIPGEYSNRSLEYDSENDLIVTSESKTIIFLKLNLQNKKVDDLVFQSKKDDNLDNNLIFQHTIDTHIQQIQIIYQGTMLLTSHQNELRLWQIDHKTKQLRIIQEFYCENNIQQFRSVSLDQIIIIKLKDKLIITDNEFRITYELQIQSDNSIQLSINYIILQQDKGPMCLYGKYIILKNQIKQQQQENNEISYPIQIRNMP